MGELRKYVDVCANKNEEELRKTGDAWALAVAKNKLVYEIDWLGVPIIQTPEDIILMQELIYDVQPDIIIEIGIAHGGGLLFYSSMLSLIGKEQGKVIGVDIDIRKHNRNVIEKHPMFNKVILVEGSSIDEETVNKVKSLVPEGARVLVCLDSNHYKNHVLQELQKYWDMVSIGSYIVVFDTISSDFAKKSGADKGYADNGPLEAVHAFLKQNSRFEIDKRYNKLYVSDCQDGFLRRIQ